MLGRIFKTWFGLPRNPSCCCGEATPFISKFHPRYFCNQHVGTVGWASRAVLVLVSAFLDMLKSFTLWYHNFKAKTVACHGAFGDTMWHSCFKFGWHFDCDRFSARNAKALECLECWPIHIYIYARIIHVFLGDVQTDRMGHLTLKAQGIGSSGGSWEQEKVGSAKELQFDFWKSHRFFYAFQRWLCKGTT